jgi:hypothetical protein
MKKTLWLFTLLVIFKSFGQENQEKTIQKVFENYKSAILNDKGIEALNFVDSRTIAYYDDIINKIKTADSITIESYTILDKLMILAIRNSASQEEIMNMNGKSLFVYAIDNGMVGKNSVQNNSIGRVQIDDAFATGQFLVNGQETPINFHFYLENNNWLIDLTSIFPISSGAFKKMIASSGKSENETLLMILELMTGEKPTNSIWHPL